MIKVREEYKQRLKAVLKEKEFNELMSKVNDRENFFDALHILTEIYLEPETFNGTDESFEIESLFSLISDDN